MKKFIVVLVAMIVAVCVVSQAQAGEKCAADKVAMVKGKVKVEGEKVMLVKEDGKSVEITGEKAQEAKALDGKEVKVVGDEKDGKGRGQEGSSPRTPPKRLKPRRLTRLPKSNRPSRIVYKKDRRATAGLFFRPVG